MTKRLKKHLARARLLWLHRDVDELVLATVAASETASYTSALEDLIRSHPAYATAAGCDPVEFAALVQAGMMIVRENKRRPGNHPDRMGRW